jgi:hypothetical protein
MGSIISFPFLCIANAALCRLSLERSEHKRFRLTNKPYKGSGAIAPLMVNGDDCLLRGEQRRLRSCWEPITAFAGLSTSIGKTYFSSKFCTINSTIFEWDDAAYRWREAKYINLGLMCGMNRASGVDGGNIQVGFHQLGTICRELKRSCPTDMWPAVKRRFIYYNKNTLDKYTGIPWFVPEWLGGVGLPMDSPTEVGDLDRRCATVIRSRAKAERTYRPCKPKDMCVWKLHQLVNKQLKPYAIEEVNFRKAMLPSGEIVDLEEEYSTSYKLLICNLLQAVPFEGIKNLLEEKGNIHKALLHNVDVWSRARSRVSELGLSVVEPMTDVDMAYENKHLVLPIFVRSFRDHLAEYIVDE